MRTTLALIAPLALAACVTASNAPIVDGGPPAPEGDLVALDQPVRVGGLVATPQEVIEDSRCPMNARCIWAGRVVLKTRIDGAGWRETAELTLGEPYATHGTTIALTSVTPETIAGEEIDVDDYRFGFEGGN